MVSVIPLVGAVIQQLAPYCREEYATFKDVNKLAEKLSRNLTSIHAVLKDAEEKQLTSHAVKDWLLNLTDAAHVLEDILDECSILSEANTDKYSIIHPKKLHARRRIGKKMKKVAERIDAIAEERVKYGLNPGTMEHRLEDDLWRQTSSFIFEPQVHGRDEDKEKVVEFLLKDVCDREELSVYSIVGHGGYGKTALAQLVFNDERVNAHFPLKIWVCVSADFNIRKLFQCIIEIIDGKNLDLISLKSMQEKVQQILQNKRYFLVLDDVWSEDPEKWSRFKYPLQNGTKGASILVTTRLETVANIVGTHPTHHLVGLSDDDIWSLFRQQAFGSNWEERAELVKIGKDIVRKCDGSPLAAKALGGLLCFKTEEHEWDSVVKSEIWKLYDDATKSALTLSYYNLKLFLRPCFTFCAVFPKDFVMVKEDLIHLWIANGFISSKGNIDIEHVGNEVWDELYQRSIFKEVITEENGNVTFKMHDIFHDIASSVMGEQCLALQTASLTTLSKRFHHLSCFNVDEQFKYSLISFKRVESLRTVLKFDPPKSNLSQFPSITPVRVLSTNCSQLSALKNFIHLRYLELYDSDIETLPESICSLRKLQTLKLVDCNKLISLPKQLSQLHDLRHLLIKGHHSLTSMPSNIGGLTHLRSLNLFIVGSKTGFGLAELNKLQLGGKLHIKGLENVSNETDAREANLIGKKELSHLYLSWDGDANSQVSDVDAERVLEALEPHSGLKSFGVKSYGGAHFPPWMRNTYILKSLVHIILYDCKNCKKLPPLGKLPCLTTLYVCGIRDLKYIDDALYEPATEKVFTSLKKLTLCDLPNLEGVLQVEGVEMLPELLNLSISCVPKLALPSLPSVELLSAHGGTEVLLKFISYKNCSVDLASLPRGIVGNNMYNLKSLYISDFAKLKKLPDELGTLCVLEHLHIQFCDEMESFSENLLQGLSSLRTLTIHYCHGFKYLSGGIKHLTCLERLQITYCPQFIFPHNMNSQTALRQLKVSGHNEKILDGLEGIPSLQNLSLTYFLSLTSLPDWLCAMTSLQGLEINRFPKLSSLPESFQQLRNLEKLSITSCPKLETRCEKGIGEDWHKIAHIAELELQDNFDAKPTFRENTTSEWKTGNQFFHRPKFESVVDV